MSVHTIEIQQTLSNRKLRDFNQMQSLFPSSALLEFMMGEINELKSRHYPVRGIRQAVLRRSPTSNSFSFLSLVVNLQSLAEDRVSVGTFDCTSASTTACERAFTNAMSQISSVRFKPLLEWSTQRIDYAMDIPGVIAPEYVLLAKRSKIPRDFRMEEDQPGSYYLKSDGANVNFYDKQDQLRKEWSLPERDRLIQDAESIFRLEIQCWGHKLTHIRRIVRRLGYEDQGVKLRTFLHPAVSNEIIHHYYADTIGYDNYYTLPAAQQRMEEHGWRALRIRKVMNFLQAICQVGSVQALRNNFKQRVMLDGTNISVGGENKTFRNYENYLAEVGINPVTLPDGERNRMPNLLSLE